MKKMTFNFFLCNLIAFGAGLVCELLFLGAISFFVHSTSLYYCLRSVCVAASLPLCLYFLCFEKNKQFKELYVTHKNEFHDSADIGKKHFGKNAKFLALILLASVVILTAMPQHWSTPSEILAFFLSLYDDLINTLIDTLLSTAFLFVEDLPDLIFGKDTWILRFSGALVWAAYCMVAYWFAMKVTLRRWDKHGTEDTLEKKGRTLLVVGGIFLQLENWVVLLIDYLVTSAQNGGDGTSGWSKMIWSLTLITVFEVLYLVEAIWAVVKDRRSQFNVYKLCVVIISAFLLMSLMYYGTAGTIVCNVCLVFLLIVECLSLYKNKKRNKAL